MTKDPRLGFAQWLHDELVSSYATESEPWALDRIHRVQGVINAARPEHPPLHERLARGREIVKELGSRDAVATPGAQRLAGN